MTDTWRNGLFDHVCGGDCGTCMGSWFCSPCLYGRTVNRYQKFPDTDKDHYDNVACNGPCWLFFGAGFCCGLQFIPLMFKRGEVRDRFGIKGDGFADCMASYCCTPCALAQLETELKDRATGAQHGGAPPLGGDIKQGYAPPPQGMNYQPGAPAYQPGAPVHQ
ncbi:hypothetical protein PRZ48_000322 [Zasmidium cellare]|uniref:Uncharacterized protein n=1 Tax=Zasmidium cellare TaxID=395010 RepID=A0ABR0EZF2_ZASCE|nr:hypothetical protein PRZ48_000322 [Zasmidium cellare]